MSSGSLAKVEKGDIELALSTYKTLAAKAHNEMYTMTHKDLKESGMTHVGMWWWKKEITDQLYLQHISGGGSFGVRGDLKIFLKHRDDMKYAPHYFMQGANRLIKKHRGSISEITSLLESSSTNYLYLSTTHCRWVKDMLSLEDIVDEV